MNKLLLLILLAPPLLASGPKNRFDDASLNDEMVNIYKDLRNPNINYGTASTMTITNLTVTTCSGCGGGATSSVTTSTLTVTSSVTLQGVTDGSNAAAGKIGEYIEGLGGVVSGTGNGQYVDAVSIPLTAGDWDVTGMYRSDVNTATWSESSIGISSTTGNSSAGLVEGSSRLASNWTASGTTPGIWSPMITLRVNLTANKTYYLKVRFSYSAGTPQVTASRLSARRVH